MRKFVLVCLILIGGGVIFGDALLDSLDAEFMEWKRTYDCSVLFAHLMKLDSMAMADSDNVEILFRFGRACSEYGDRCGDDKSALEWLDKGISALQRVLDLAGDNYLYHYHLGVCIGRKGKRAGIMRSLFLLKPYDGHLKKSIELNPNYPAPYIAMGVRYLKVPGIAGGSAKKAKEYLEQALALDSIWMYMPG